MRQQQKIGIWITWIIGWPISLWLVYSYFGFHLHGHWLDYLLFVLLAILVAIFPTQVRGTDLVFTQGILLAIFLQFGFFAEIAAQQVATLAFLFFLRVGRNDSERYPLNLMMFFVVSFVSGLAFFASGGNIGSMYVDSVRDFIPIIVYVVCNFLSNQLLLMGIRYALMKQREQNFLGLDLVWESITTVLMVPIAIVLYILYLQMNMTAILFVGFPFVSLSYMLRLYHSSEKINNLLQKTNNIGQQLTAKLDVDRTLDFFISQVTEVFPVEVAYILDTDDLKQRPMGIRRVYEKEKGMHNEWSNLKIGEGISGKVWENEESIRYFSRKQWQYETKEFVSKKVQSIISVPVRRNQEVVGIVTLGSVKKHAYDRNHQMILEILANFLAVAVENARNYQRTKNLSERDALTNLYNYRYFIELLEAQFLGEPDNFPFSIILLDLDFFKKINDTYGHETGNEVLRELAGRLLDLVGSDGVVARYGGEEFVILLENLESQSALQVAEKIRMGIADQPFLADYQMDKSVKHPIFITASIGVATAPYQGEDTVSLIRNADRAMYNGAKQNGKNRVAAYMG